MRVLGIDPGLSGALAWVSSDGQLGEVEDMPVVDSAVNPYMLTNLIIGYGPTHLAVIERAQPMPKQGISSAFNYGTGYGVLLGALGALQIPTYIVTASHWKRRMSLNSDKEHSRRVAIARWPGHVDRFTKKKDHGRAEAALLALSWIMDPENSTIISSGRVRRVIRRSAPP